jgi:hypothetical protein
MNNINKSPVEIYLDSAEWIYSETKVLIEKYNQCKTQHAKNRLLPKLHYMAKKLQFEKEQLRKLIYD